MKENEFVTEILRLDEKISGDLDFSYLVRELCERYKQELAVVPGSASPNTGMNAIAEMDKAVRCLAIQVPESVYDDVKRRWDAVVAQQRHA